jgi:hypothetical protein
MQEAPTCSPAPSMRTPFSSAVAVPSFTTHVSAHSSLVNSAAQQHKTELDHDIG